MNVNFQQPFYQDDYSRTQQQVVYPQQQPQQQGLYPQSNLQQQTLSAIRPAVRHGLREAQNLGYQHALREAVAIGYLMGRGYDFYRAWRTVESWQRPPGASLPTTPY